MMIPHKTPPQPVLNIVIFYFAGLFEKNKLYTTMSAIYTADLSHHV